MRLGKLYIKIFLSCLLALFVAEVLILGLFFFAAREGFHTRIDRYIRVNVQLAKQFVEENIKSNPQVPPDKNQPLKDVVMSLAEAYGAKVWLVAPDGTPLLKSFSGSIPQRSSRVPDKPIGDFGGFRLYHRFKKGGGFYAIIPTEIYAGEVGGLHILFERKEEGHPEAAFAIGLLVIGVVVAILVIPVSRLITKRVGWLMDSALRISEGDLSHRAVVKGKDEIGELGRAFNQMADKLERMIRGGKELTANISHELRSPLARIRIAEELLREKLEREQHQDWTNHLDDIREDIDELDRLIGRILDLSKLDIQDEPPKRESIDPSELIDELLERLRPRITRKHLRLTTALSFDPPFRGDKEALRTALSNILDNAVKFAPEEGEVIVEMHSEGESLKSSVTNTFEALPSDDLTRVFEPFYRTERPPAQGSGLGLAITKKIIERHGGSIEASNSTEGFRIQITLPSGSAEKGI